MPNAGITVNETGDTLHDMVFLISYKKGKFIFTPLFFKKKDETVQWNEIV